jgi:hypothetical protein
MTGHLVQVVFLVKVDQQVLTVVVVTMDLLALQVFQVNQVALVQMVVQETMVPTELQV